VCGLAKGGLAVGRLKGPDGFGEKGKRKEVVCSVEHANGVQVWIDSRN